MKKKIIALGLSAFLLSGLSSYAQKSSAILRAGFNLANVSINSDGTIDDAKMLPTFHVGVIGDLPITGFFSVQTGLLFTGKGKKHNSAILLKLITTGQKPIPFILSCL
jgi:hypothetical protein